MATHALIRQICNVSPKRLIQIFVFMLINLKCYQMEDLHIKRCWVFREERVYRDTYVLKNIMSLEECLNYCEYELPHCDVFVIVTDKIGNFKQCSVKNNTEPVDHTDYEILPYSNSYIRNLKCSRNETGCWIMKGNLFHVGLQHFHDSSGTLELCMDRCQNEFPHCDVINYLYPEFGGDGCWIKTEEGPLNNYLTLDAMASYMLDRICLTPVSQTSTAQESDANATIGEKQTNPAESGDSRGKSFLEEYNVYVMAVTGAVVGIILLTCVIIVVKHRKAKNLRSSAISANTIEPGTA